MRDRALVAAQGARRRRELGAWMRRGVELALTLQPDGRHAVVDVLSEIVIVRPRSEVAAFATDPDNARDWYENIEAIQWHSPRPLTVGSRIEFVAAFLGRRIAYTYEIKEYMPDERLRMSTAEGPFPMETTYTWQDLGDGATRMSLRNRGQPSGFSKVTAPIIERAMRRANRKDLAQLKAILERPASAL